MLTRQTGLGCMAIYKRLPDYSPELAREVGATFSAHIIGIDQIVED